MLDLNDIQRDLEKLRLSREVLSYVADCTGAFGVLVIEHSGEPVVETGVIEGEISLLAKQVAEQWSTTGKIAKMLGEISFNEMILTGGSRHLYTTQAGLSHLLVVIYGIESNLGLVKLYAGAAADRVASLIIDEVNPQTATEGVEQTG